MNFITWLKEKFGLDTVPLTNICEADEYAALVADLYIREMAFWSGVNLIANAISKCEFRTYLRNKEVKKQEYYLWNIEPNQNENSSQFIHNLIAKLYRDNEALVIESNSKLYVADSFDRTQYALYDDVFSQVALKDFTFNKRFKQSEVLYFKLSEAEVRRVINGIYNSYSALISYSMNSYKKSRGTKGIFKYETIPTGNSEERKAFDALVNEKISKWLGSETAALPLGKGQEWKEITQKTYSSESTRDIKALIDDIFDFTARGMGIPPVLLKGDLANVGDNVINNFLTFTVDPLTDKIQEEINRKRSGYAGMSSGTYVDIDTKTIKHIDLLSMANPIDKLISSGAFSINDIRKTVSEPVIDEDWANKHYITKNYSPIDESLESVNKEGGEIIED